MRALLAVMLLGHAARADDLSAIEKSAPACDKARAHCIAVQLHVAADERGLVASPDWIAAQLAAANRHFAPLDVAFQLAGVDELPASAAHLETRRDRDALASSLGGSLIHVFVVGQLDDVDEEGAIAYGVTWHVRNDDRRYVIVSAQALERTLAHELGHYFGLSHSAYAISIMNKSDRAEPPVEQRTFADEEIAAMKPRLARLLRERSILDYRRIGPLP